MPMRRTLQSALHYNFLKMQAVLLLALGRSQRVLPHFEQMLQLRPLDRYALASRAHVQVQLKKSDDAIESLRQLTGAWPHEAASWFNLGYALQQTGRDQEAESAFRSALALDARMDRAWYGLALVLIQLRQFEAAAGALEENTVLQPMSPYGWYRLAQVRLALHQPDQALKVIAHLRQFEPRVADQWERETGMSLPAAPRPAGHGRPVSAVTASVVRDAA